MLKTQKSFQIELKYENITINYQNYFEQYQKDYVLITDKVLENAVLIGEVIDDKIIFDDILFEKEKIKDIYFNKLTEKMK